MRADVRVVHGFAACAADFTNETGVFENAQVKVDRRQTEVFTPALELEV